MINPFKKSYSKEEINTFRFLSRIKLFSLLSNDELSEFVPYLYPRKYKKDEVVFFRDDPSQALYIVKRGEVTLNIDISDRFEKLVEVKSGQAFGDNTLLNNTKRLYTAVISSDTATLFVIPQVNIQDIFNSNDKIKAKMLNSLAEMYNQYTGNLFKAYKSSFGFFDIAEAYRG
ncbi:MAG: cyclic nucleotide-binding domain-containing protein [Cytophagales bacterium]|nr:cyclic nucleotide-binding domain-containing protein [Cytophagales bacterium]